MVYGFIQILFQSKIVIFWEMKDDITFITCYKTGQKEASDGSDAWQAGDSVVCWSLTGIDLLPRLASSVIQWQVNTLN